MPPKFFELLKIACSGNIKFLPDFLTMAGGSCFDAATHLRYSGSGTSSMAVFKVEEMWHKWLEIIFSSLHLSIVNPASAFCNSDVLGKSLP
jgi:hypothetical protein